MNAIDFQQRTRVVFGAGTIDRLGELARGEGARRALVVTDPGIIAAGHVERGVQSLRSAGVHVAVFDGVQENPTSRHVAAGVEVARAESVDSLVGLGGGSSMDCAKGINFIFSCGGEMRDYRGIGRATGPMLPLIAVPTTAGTGSETQSFALISDPQTRQKMACGDKRAACRVALLDPELTLSQPAAVTVATGMDAVSHAVESFVTRRRNAVSAAFARQAWISLFRSFARVLDEPNDIEARGEMLLGASLAGMAIENSMLGAAHSCANPVTARHGTVHGVAVSIFLPHIVRFNGAEVDSLYRELVALAGISSEDEVSSAMTLSAALEGLFDRAGERRSLSACGVAKDEIPALAREAASQWTAQFNPRPVTEADLRRIYECAY